MKIILAVLLMIVYTGIGGPAMAEEADNTQYITPSGAQPSRIGSADYFTGHVRVDPLFSHKDADAPFGASYVTFAPGARSFWHTHPTGQHLIVTHGTGWTAAWEGEKTVISAGDVVWCPPGVKHWHGATATTGMTHIALSGVKDGGNAEWLEPVSDEQYNK